MERQLASIKIPPRFEAGRKKRQKILDFLNTNGPAENRYIAAAAGLNTVQTRAMVRAMYAHAEIGYDDEMEGKVLVRRYKALTTVAVRHRTLSPEEKAARRSQPLHPSAKQKVNAGTVGGPGSKIYCCDDSRPPHPHQGGQGGVTRPYSGTYLAMSV